MPVSSFPPNVGSSNEDNVEVLNEDNISDNEERDIDIVHVSTRKSFRVSQAPSHLQDYICISIGGNYPMRKFLSYSTLFPKHQLMHTI